MENINLITIGVKGGKSKLSKVGYAELTLRHILDFIAVDDFEGQGKDYKQRELQLIKVVHNDETLFSGTKYELFDILRSHKDNLKAVSL